MRIKAIQLVASGISLVPFALIPVAIWVPMDWPGFGVALTVVLCPLVGLIASGIVLRMDKAKSMTVWSISTIAYSVLHIAFVVCLIVRGPDSEPFRVV